MPRTGFSLTYTLALALPLLLAACNTGAPPVATPAVLPAPQPIGGGNDPAASGINPADLCLESQVVRDGKVTPATISAKAPCRIMFTNRDETPVQITGQGIQIGPLGKDESWVQSFRQPGTYTWADLTNPSIAGTIVIQ